MSVLWNACEANRNYLNGDRFVLCNHSNHRLFPGLLSADNLMCLWELQRHVENLVFPGRFLRKRSRWCTLIGQTCSQWAKAAAKTHGQVCPALSKTQSYRESLPRTGTGCVANAIFYFMKGILWSSANTVRVPQRSFGTSEMEFNSEKLIYNKNSGHYGILSSPA